MKRNTLLCTVGTSLFTSNLQKIEGINDKPNNWMEISKHYKEKNWDLLVNELLKVDPNHRICGAEINTIEAARKKKWLELENLFFLVSDTQLGRETGEFLKKYYSLREDLNLKNIDYKVVEQLQDAEPKKFKSYGLRNLVRVIGDILNKFEVDKCAIDATGGYKAQIAIAVLIGQALDIPVYYKHELFNEIIDFPPLPISLDYDLLGRFAPLFNHLEKNNVIELSKIDDFDEKLRVFLNEVSEGNETLFELNAIGQLYITSFRLRYPYIQKLKEIEDKERKEPTFSEHHYPKGFKDFVQKIWKENKFIKTCFSLDYSKQQSIKQIEFFVRKNNEKEELIGHYLDKNGFGARFRIVLSDESMESLNWAAEFLNREYGD